MQSLNIKKSKKRVNESDVALPQAKFRFKKGSKYEKKLQWKTHN